MKDFKKCFENLKEFGVPVPEAYFSISIPDAKTFFTECLTTILEMQHKKFIWLPEYEEVVKWLSNSGGKSLFLYGNCGRGKSLIARYLIPTALHAYHNRICTVVDAVNFAQNINDYLSRYFLVVDDIGTEDFTNEYGSRRMAFSELMDSVEKTNKTVIITSNLGAKQIQEKYGDRTLDRIKSTCIRVLFKGDSLRG